MRTLKKLGVIGDPIAHSLSPNIFSFLKKKLTSFDNELFESYLAYRVSNDELHFFIHDSKIDFLGLNVTVPHKEKIFSISKNLSSHSQLIGSVNCLHFNNKEISGHNTDWIGFIQPLLSFSLKTFRTLIIGSGGACRAAAYALGEKQTAFVFILSRNLGSALKICNDFKHIFPKTTFMFGSEISQNQNEFDLIVNTTPIGMLGFGTSSTISMDFSPYEFFEKLLFQIPSKNSIAYDLIYRPQHTPFLDVAKGLGFKIIGGIPMLIGQALESWEIWFGALGDRSEIQTELTSKMNLWLKERQVQRIFLTGFMGVGKSTVGRLLANKLNWEFVDTDREIEVKTGETIGQLFQRGESYFRSIEKRTVEDLIQKDKIVVSLGGGAIMNQELKKNLQDSGVLIYLSASETEILRRLSESSLERPLLAKTNNEKPENSNDLNAFSNERKSGQTKISESEVRRILSLRLSTYSSSDVEFFTDQMTPKKIVEKIVEYLEIDPGAT